MNDIFCAMVDNVNMKDAQPNDIYGKIQPKKKGAYYHLISQSRCP